MKMTSLFSCISEAMDDENVAMIEIVGIKHVFSFNPNKIINIMIKYDCLWIVKQQPNETVENLLINPDQIVYVRILKEA